MTALQEAFRKSSVCRKLARAMLREMGEPARDPATTDLICDGLAEFDDYKIVELLEEMEPLYPKQCSKLLSIKPE